MHHGTISLIVVRWDPSSILYLADLLLKSWVHLPVPVFQQLRVILFFTILHAMIVVSILCAIEIIVWIFTISSELLLILLILLLLAPLLLLDRNTLVLLLIPSRLLVLRAALALTPVRVIAIKSHRTLFLASKMTRILTALIDLLLLLLLLQILLG